MRATIAAIVLALTVIGCGKQADGPSETHSEQEKRSPIPAKANRREQEPEAVLPKRDPAQAEKEVARGIALHDREEYEKAIEHYSRAIELDSRNSLAYLYRADAYTFLDNYEKAITDYTRGIELNPLEATAYMNRGKAYTHLDKYDEAILDYRESLRLNPGLARVHANLGDVFYHGKKDYGVALRHYRAALKLNPGDGVSRDKVAELEKRLPNKGIESDE